MRLLRLPNKDMVAASLFMFEMCFLVHKRRQHHFFGNIGAL